jgi:M6 family metalloprotease-like protein
MKPLLIIHPLRLVVALAVCLGYATAAPYGSKGRETRWIQPSGLELKLSIFGDDSYARTETADGYTVVYNSADNTYYYAVLSPDGSAFLSSGIKAGGKIPTGLAKHLVLPPSEIRKISAANRSALDGERQARWKNRVQAAQKLRAAARNEVALGADEAAQANIQAAPVVGEIKGLTILVQFPNDPRTPPTDPVNFPVDQQKIIRYCNQAGYTENGNTGSVSDYFKDQSLGQLNYTQIVTEIVTMPEPRNYYNFSDYPTNSRFRDDASRVLTTDAIKVLQARGFDFTGLSTDREGRAFATNVFFAGPDSGVWAQGLWPQQWSLENPLQVGTEAIPVSIFNFQIVNLENTAPTIGTFCHENGHLILDYPDLYDIEGEGVGEHCLMGSGNQLNDERTPSPLNAYFKDIVGWGNVIDLTTRDYATLSLPTTGNIAYRISKPATTKEYFIVENRGAGDKWARYSKDKGIAIWHIDEEKDGNLRSRGHYEVSLEQADGKDDLEKGRNRGDRGDLFDLDTPLFSDKTTPNAEWWDGKASSVQINVLSKVGSRMDVLFGTTPPNTIIVESPNGGDVIYPGLKYTVLWSASIDGNVRIELYKAGVFHSLITGSTPNDGSFVWSVDPTLKGNSDFNIRISSLTNIVAVEDFSDAPFTINSSTFPADGLMPEGWFRPVGSAIDWAVTNSVAYEGNRSLMSNRVGDGKSAGVAYKGRFKEGSVGFFIRVSSEKDYDVARFYIDNVPQALTPDDTTNGLSGAVNWTYVSIKVPAGAHTFKWTYEKDDSYSELSDRAWIDGVTLPPLALETVALNQNSAALPSWNVADFVATAITNTSSIASSDHTALLTGGASPLLRRAVSLEIIDGRRYLALTVTKPPGVRIVGTVEVSSNLMDWYSGKNHTTTLLNSPTTLKVRDNTPTSPAAKRYIRLK